MIWHGLYRLHRIFSWVMYRVPRRFTPMGLVVLAALVLSALVGLDTENTVAYQGFALLFVVLLIAWLFAWFFRLRFEVTRRLPHFGTVGQPLIYQVSVRNLTAKTQLGLVLLEDLADVRPRFAEWKAMQQAEERTIRSFRFNQRRRPNPFKAAALKAAPVPPMPPGLAVDVRVELTPLRRGVLRFTGVTIARPDPFGLCRAFSRRPAPQSALILPRRYPLPTIPLPGALKYQEGGVALASNVGQSEEFVALRDYRRGDPLRHIHWRSWARTGKPIVKEFEDEYFVRHALILDTFIANPYSEEFEEAVSVAASFVCDIQTQESLLDLLFVGAQAYCFTSGRGLAHEDQMLEILASVRICPDHPFRSLEALVLDHLDVVSGCICVLLAWDEERRSFVKRVKSLGIPVLVYVVLPADHGQLLEPGPMTDAPDHFHVLEVGKIEEGLMCTGKPAGNGVGAER